MSTGDPNIRAHDWYRVTVTDIEVRLPAKSPEHAQQKVEQFLRGNRFMPGIISWAAMSPAVNLTKGDSK